MIRLFLDDIRMPDVVAIYVHPNIASMYRLYQWSIVRNYAQFINFINSNGIPDIISFDHDLAEIHYDPSTWKEEFKYDEETGYDCMKWMIDYIIDNNINKLPEVYIHSMNPVGAKNMKELWANFVKKCNSNE